MIIVKVYDPSVKPEVFIKDISYSTCDWPRTSGTWLK